MVFGSIWLLARPQARQYHIKLSPISAPYPPKRDLLRDHHRAHGAAGTNTTRVPRILSSQFSRLDNFISERRQRI